MVCPKCGYNNQANERKCRKCQSTLTTGESRAKVAKTPARIISHILMWIMFALITIVVLGIAAYRIYYWYDAWRLENYYEINEIMEPLVEEITMDYGMAGHAITFFGDDGDSIFVKELNRSYIISGGLVSVQVEDSYWVSGDPETADALVITLTPVKYTENGEQIELPEIIIETPVPQSPLTLINPESDFTQVNTSIYPLSIQVVPDSVVLVNGEDVTDIVDYAGMLSVNINVYPQGDNLISLLVSTDKHKQTRTDINLYREHQDINLEPSLTLEETSNRRIYTVSGTIDPDALLTVDTDYVEDSIYVDASGNFNFRARLSVIGDNTITFRASKEGLTDSVVSVSVYYVPTLNEYSRMAWAMDYEQLKLYYETWNGRVFLCEGTVVEVVMNGEEQTVYMDVSDSSQPQYVALVNYSSVGTPEVGTRYRAYADVLGNAFYIDDYVPRLACRYMLVD
ncbi:MAG: zinc ribbon domain-containing protein [Clostridia bacterium]|nr:zinc ribbon domain-containing protein [Clostridia bacterium]